MGATDVTEGLGSAASHIRGGTIRALAVTSPKRSPAFPDIPTMAEAGGPAIEAATWVMFLAPAGTPREIVSRLSAEVAKAVASPFGPRAATSLTAFPNRRAGA